MKIPTQHTSTKHPDEMGITLEGRCRQAIQRYTGLPGFQLIEPEEFCQKAVDRLSGNSDQVPESQISNTILNIYAETLYLAVNSNEEPDLLSQGFQELSRYLYRMAYNFYLHQNMEPDEGIEQARDCTQKALERIYKKLQDVKSPGSFLKWCGVILRNTCLEEVRSRKIEYALDDELPVIDVPGELEITSLESGQEIEWIKEAVARLKKDQQQVIELTFFASNPGGKKLKDEEISRKMNITMGNLYTIRSRALAELRKDEQLLGCIQGEL